MNCFNVHKICYSKLFHTRVHLSSSSTGSDASFPEQNWRYRTWTPTLLFTKLCILSVAMTSKVLNADRHSHSRSCINYHILTCKASKHVTSMHVSYLIYSGHLTDAKNSTEMHRMIWKTQCKIAWMAHMPNGHVVRSSWIACNLS